VRENYLKGIKTVWLFLSLDEQEINKNYYKSYPYHPQEINPLDFCYTWFCKNINTAFINLNFIPHKNPTIYKSLD